MTRSLADRVLPNAVRNQLDRTTGPFLSTRANGKGVCSASTRKERVSIINLAFAQLWTIGYRIQKPASLSEKHVKALMSYWDAQGLSASLLHTRLSTLKTFCDWLGKRGVVKHIHDYLPDERVARPTVATKDRSWKANGVDPAQIIELAMSFDERLGAMLTLQHNFALRVKESIEIHPANSVVENGTMLEIYEGTKGGRLRRVPIKTEEHRQAIALVRRVAAKGATGRLRWPDCSWRKAQNRFYYLIRTRLGITRALKGVTAHGARHGWAHEDYEVQSGFPAPIKGGALGQIDRETHRMACITVSRALGHGRVDVTSTYYGSYGHGLRGTPVKMTMKTSLPA
ncbi:MAG: integrase domain-containing protein [Sulfuricella sp.]|nr:integrase domain-containing protein [Sulfuricella sp.]